MKKLTKSKTGRPDPPHTERGNDMETIDMEVAYDRLCELREHMERFPESELVPIFKAEVEYLINEIEKNMP